MKSIEAIYLKEQHMQKAGDRYFSYGECTYYALPFSIKPTEGEHDYRLCDSCQEARKEIIRQLKKRVKKFPNCCEAHKRLLSLKEFNRSDFRDAAELCADKVLFTYQHIINRQSSAVWKVEISQYIDKAIESFGCFPDGFGEPFLLGSYISFVRQLVNNNSSIRQEVREFVNGIFDKLYIKKEKVDPIATLCKIYDDWLNIIPFDLPFLKDVRDDFRNMSPLMVYDKHDSNGNVCHYLFSNSQLLDYLKDLTASLLIIVGEKIAKIEIIELSEYYNEYVRQKLLFNNLLLVEQYESYPFVEIIKRWMDNQTSFFNDLNKLNEIRCYRGEDAYPNDSYKESLKRVGDFKRYLEYNDVGILINSKCKEQCLQKLFKMIWRTTSFDFNAEVNNGRGPVDFTVSKGSKDKTIIEFKLASNSKLRQNLQNQVEIYKQSNNTTKTIAVLFYFIENEKGRLYRILDDLQLSNLENVIVIDCCRHKVSASNVTSIKGNRNNS